MSKLSITTQDSGKIHEALGISKERATQIADKIAETIDTVVESMEENPNPLRITDLAKLSIDAAEPESANELFYIGIKFGEIVEQNSMNGAMHSMLEAIMPSESDLARSILRSTSTDE